jgi:hypothetical protein
MSSTSAELGAAGESIFEYQIYRIQKKAESNSL